MDLLTPESKQSVQAAFQNIHDTFSRPINIHMLQSGTVAVITDPTYNSLYGQTANAKHADPILKSYSTNARILYNKDQKLANGSDERSLANLLWAMGAIRLKIDAAAYQMIKDCKKIEVDGQLCELDSGAARTGPFIADFFTIFLKRAD